MTSLLQVRKYVLSGNIQVGGFVTYRIVTTNIGQVTYSGPITLQDTSGLGLQWNGAGGWNVVGSKLEKTYNTILNPGLSTADDITFSITSCVNLLINSVDLLAGEVIVSRDSVALTQFCENKFKSYGSCLKL